MADVLELCNERWQKFKRKTLKDVVRHCDGFKDKDRRALRYLRKPEENGLLESKAETTENAPRSLSSPPNSRPVTADRTVGGVLGVSHWGHFRRLGHN